MKKIVYVCDICGREIEAPGIEMVPLHSKFHFHHYNIVDITDIPEEGITTSCTLDICPDCQFHLNSWIEWMKATEGKGCDYDSR